MYLAKQNSFIVDTTSFSVKFPKNGRFRLPWSTINRVNQRRRPNPTVAPREVKLRFWLFAAGCRFLLGRPTQCRNFFVNSIAIWIAWTFSLCTSMHNWRLRIDTDFHWKNTDFPHEIVACLRSIRQSCWRCCEQCHCSGGCTWHPEIHGERAAESTWKRLVKHMGFVMTNDSLRRRQRICPHIRRS